MSIISSFPMGENVGSGLSLNEVSNVKILTASEKVYIKWTDPGNIVLDDIALAEWKGTILVRKAGSTPTNRQDGTIVIDSVTHNAYSDKYFTDSGLSNGVTYYYKFFSYTKSYKYTDSELNVFTATPNAVKLGNVSDIVATTGDGKIKLTWTDPDDVVTDGITVSKWVGTKVVYKTGSYPTSPEDGMTVANITTKNQHKTTPLIIRGLTNGVTYYVAHFPYSTDGVTTANNSNRITAVPNYIGKLIIPTQSNTLTYTGASQTPTWNNYDSTKMTLSGVTSGTNAGSYNAIFTLIEDYAWTDNTADLKTVAWTIGRATVAVPNQSGTLTYSGANLSPTWTGYDSTKMTIGGTTTGINAGTYNATFVPLGNFKWTDNSTSTKTVGWTIGKAAGSLTLSVSSLTLTQNSPTGTITVTRAGDGAITAVSSNTAVATVSVSSNVVTVTGVATGNTTVTVNVAAGTNHTAASKACTVDVQLLPASGKALNDYTWAEISQISNAGMASNYWSVGSTKQVVINGTVGVTTFNKTYNVFILGFNHRSTNSITFGGFKSLDSSPVDICLTDKYFQYYYTNGTKTFNMFHNDDSGNGGWKASDIRYDILGSTNVKGGNATSTTATNPVSGSLMAALPSDLRSVMKSVTIYTDNIGGTTSSGSISATVDYLFLLSECELTGKSQTSNPYEASNQTQYSYYAVGNSYAKKASDSANVTAEWWLRSPYYGASNRFCIIGNTGGISQMLVGQSCGIAPAFVV